MEEKISESTMKFEKKTGGRIKMKEREVRVQENRISFKHNFD